MHSNETPTSAFQSPILLMAKRAATLRAERWDVIDLALGEPDFNATEHVLDAAHLALGSRLTYSPSNAIEPLRKAIRMRAREDRELDFGDDQMAVGCGAKQIIFNAFQAPLKPGDDVIVPAPYWASYPAMIKMGAFNLLRQIKTGMDDQTLALDLLEVGVATVPGSAFWLPGYLRLSFATDEATLVEGCKRLARALEAYS
ncbi:aminotransferase class I/II-fold pyridoxal phosphate-dependent enzyme [Pseudomonas protegens]|uniref:aminotransferase class I/II-fold pyridoxal phosphate-dependent enzyme n=1 Tax=Pseudomonas protegens TaxID=380021 RepID=UPI003FD6FF01